MSTEVFLEQTHHLRNRPDEQWGSYRVSYRDLRPLKLNIASPFVPFLVRPGWGGRDGEVWRDLVGELVTLSREKPSPAPMIFLTQHDCPPSIQDLPSLKQHAIAILDKGTIASFTATREWDQKWLVLGRALVRNIGMSALHPYVPGTPASGARFFGRTKVIDQIVAGKTIRNCTIVGNRRIGKTSLMKEVVERLKEVYVEKQTIFFANLYAANLKSTWDAVYLLCSQLDINVPKKYTKLGAISERYVNRFPKLLHNFAHDRQAAVVILIDEFDKFLEIDAHQDYQFLHLLREAAMAEANCHVLIAGFRRLMELRVRQESPYFNFTSEIAVTPLTREETTEMITLPLSRLGIDVLGTNLPVVIHRETHGQPELVQMYCKAVVELHEKAGKVPKDNELQEYVRRNRDFSRTIFQTFLNNTNPYEQAICLHLIQQAPQSSDLGQFRFSLKQVEEIRAHFEFPLTNAQTATLLNNLVVGSVIERITGAPGEYRFAVPQLLRFCRERDIFTLLAAAEAEARRNPPSIEALNMDTGLDGQSTSVA